MKLEIRNIHKSYNKFKALNNVTLSFSNGVHALLGPNGAGKSTLINIIVGLLKQDAGEMFYNDVECQKLGLEYIGKIGFVPQFSGYYKKFTAKEFLLYISALKEVSNAKSKVEEVLKTVNLQNVSDNKIHTFSGGMKQRLAIAQALINDPEILVLDEPTAGLDPKERTRLRNIISALGNSKIIIFATHIVSDVEYIAKNIIFINNGEIVAQGCLEEILNSTNGNVWELEIKSTELEAYMQNYKVSNIYSVDDKNIIKIVSQCEILNAKNVKPTLDDVCLHYFGEL